ncbi:MAG: hypothetical protein HUU23_02630, partial [Caldilineales bacterium]|nr:hypothetical protein [Caldilineales bacterium]
MSLTPALLRWLQEEAADLLAALTAAPPDEADLLPLLTRLRRDHTPAQAA